MSDILISQQMPILALRGLTVFPEMVVHFDIGREKSILAMEAAMNEEQTIFLVTQKDVFVDDPKQKDLYEVGTVAHIKQVLRLPHDSIRILVNGLYRAKISSMEQDGPYLEGRVETLNIPSYRKQTPKIVALLRQSAHYFEQMMELSQKPQQEIMLRLVSTTDPGIVADALGQYATFGYEEKMQILKQLHPVKRLELANRLLAQGVAVLPLRRGKMGGGQRRRPVGVAPIDGGSGQQQPLGHGRAGSVEPQGREARAPQAERRADALVEQIPGEDDAQVFFLQAALFQGRLQR